MLPREDAINLAREKGLDLIEVSEDKEKSVARIMDWGKFMYEQKKKSSLVKKNSKSQEIKSVQIRPSTDKGGMMIKAKQAKKWAEEGHRIKVELYVPGRYRFVDKEFLMQKLQEFLDLFDFKYKIVENTKKIPKGYYLLIEGENVKKNKQVVGKENKGDKERSPDSEGKGTESPKGEEVRQLQEEEEENDKV